MQAVKTVLRALAVIALSGSVSALSGCPEPTSEGGSSGAAPAQDTPAAEGSAAAVAAGWKVKTAAGDEVAKIDIDGSTIKIAHGGKVIKGKGKGDKRRYESDGAFVVEVKAGDGKLKLKDEGGKLLWKVKLGADKIKVSDNEEGDNAYSVKPKDDGFKVERGDQQLGKVKHSEGRVKVKDAQGKELFKGQADRASAGWGVLLMTDIPEAQRYILMAEIGARGR